MKIEIKETPRLAAARAAEDALAEAYDRATRETRRAVHDAAGVVPGKTIVSWKVGKDKSARGVLLEVSGKWSTRVRVIKKDGKLGMIQTRATYDFEILPELWEGEAP